MKNKIIISKILVLFMFVSLGFLSCKTNDDVNTFEKEMELLAEYIADNDITVSPTASGLYYIELVEGIGELAKNGDTVWVKYTGRLIDGIVFDTGTFNFTLGIGSVIKGWDEGIAMMKKEGSAVFIIPSNIAYGAAGAGSIPPYTTLIFTVELIDLQ